MIETMWPIGWAILFALFTWWFSTGVILILVRMRREAHPAGMAIITLVALLSVAGLIATRDVTTENGAFAGFTYGLAIWAWHEMSFLYGYVTGPRKGECPPLPMGMARFRLAYQTISHHEWAILATGAFLVWLTWGAANQIGTWTYLALWGMRISAKLNVFLGAPNVAEEFLPAHLAYLKSYFRRERINLLFPVSVTLGSLAFGVMVHIAVTTGDAYTATAMTLLATLTALAVVEHWFLVLPIPDATLWRWALKFREAPATTDIPSTPLKETTREPRKAV